MEHTLFSFGHGYSAQALAADLRPQGVRIYGTTRNPDKLPALAQTGITPVLWPDTTGLESATHVLISSGPDAQGDPVLNTARVALAQRAPHLQWLGYLSTTGVYGDHQGGWVDEASTLTPATQRGRWRVAAETAWQAFARETGAPLHIFRLAGIYGPGRGPFAKLCAGTARRIIKPGQVFSRIHVEDIAQTLAASMARPNPGAIYNLCDDDPAPPQDVIAHAADLLGLPHPAELPYEEADLPPMARSFYAESKRVRNDRIKAELGVRLRYPSYRSGLAAILEAKG
jgi:nucleoside-diphosphate-sugar epimerase